MQQSQHWSLMDSPRQMEQLNCATAVLEKTSPSTSPVTTFTMNFILSCRYSMRKGEMTDVLVAIALAGRVTPLGRPLTCLLLTLYVHSHRWKHKI